MRYIINRYQWSFITISDAAQQQMEVIMNGLVIITNRQKLIICLAALAFIILSAFFIANLDFPKAVETGSSRINTARSPETENKQLKDLLSSILPADNKVLYENSNRGIGNNKASQKISELSTSEIISKGKNLAYLFVYSDEEYLRPIYTNLWKQSFYQGWLYLPRKIIAARHSLFTYTGGAGKVFDIEGQLGFYPNITIDNQNYFNFLIYNFDLENISQLGNDIAITGKPMKKGIHIISIKIEDVAALVNENGNITVHLCTPAGHELDYQNLPFSKDSNKVVDFGLVEESYIEESKNYETDLSSFELSQQNIVLKQQLTHFISDSSKPIYFQPNGTYQTANNLDVNVDIEDALTNQKIVKYTKIYNNKKYESPIFHPQWKAHYDREWCYIPRKMYLNMKRVFVLPSEKDVASDLLGELGFFEKFSGVSEDKTGIVVNNFNLKNIGIYEDSILLQGIPARSGMQIVGIDKKYLKEYKEYTVRLVTTDACEIDTDVVRY